MAKSKSKPRPMSYAEIATCVSKANCGDKLKVIRGLDDPATTYTIDDLIARELANRPSEPMTLELRGRNGAKYTMVGDGSTWTIGSSVSGVWRGRTVHAAEHFSAQARVGCSVNVADLAVDVVVETADAFKSAMAAPEVELVWKVLDDLSLPLPPDFGIQVQVDPEGRRTGLVRPSRPWGHDELAPVFEGVDALAKAVAHVWQQWTEREERFNLAGKARSMGRVLEQIRQTCAPEVEPGDDTTLRLVLAEQALHSLRAKGPRVSFEATYRRALELGGGMSRTATVWAERSDARERGGATTK